MKSLHRTALRAAAALCVLAAGATLAIHAEDPPQQAPQPQAIEPVLDLAAAAIPMTLEPSDAAGKSFNVGHSTDTAWYARVTRHNPRSPAVADGIVVVGSGSGTQIHGYAADTGERKWTTSSKDSGISDIVIGLGRAYYTTHSCTIESVRVSDGQMMYSKWLAPTVDCGPDVKDELVATAFCNKGAWQVSMRDAQAGGQKWNSKVGNQAVLTAPMIMDSSVYLTTADGSLTRLNAAKGKQEWKADLGAVSAPVPTRWGLLLTTTWDNSGDTKTGKAADSERKQRDRETVTDGESIPGTLISARNRRVALLNQLSTQPKGKVGSQDVGPRGGLDFQGVRPGVTDRHVIMAYGGRISAVEPVSGRAEWSIKLADEKCNFTRPVAHRGLVFVATDTGVVAAIEETTGALIWAYRFAGCAFIAQPAVDDSRLFLTNSIGQLIALPTGAGEVDAGAPQAEADDPEGTAGAYWKVQELFRRVRDIVREIEAAKPIEPEKPTAGDGSPSGGPGGGAPQEEAARPREDDEVDELTKGQWERREDRRQERAKSENKQYERKDYKR